MLNCDIRLLHDRKHCLKRRKCWSPAFSTFPTMFSKIFLFLQGREKSFVGIKHEQVEWNFEVDFIHRKLFFLQSHFFEITILYRTPRSKIKLQVLGRRGDWFTCVGA